MGFYYFRFDEFKTQLLPSPTSGCLRIFRRNQATCSSKICNEDSNLIAVASIGMLDCLRTIDGIKLT
ncbi:unnamed protein product [Prunus armeniaca]